MFGKTWKIKRGIFTLSLTRGLQVIVVPDEKASGDSGYTCTGVHCWCLIRFNLRTHFCFTQRIKVIN